MSQDYSAPMPQKLSQTRTTTGGYQQGSIARAGRHTESIKAGMVDQHGTSVDQVTLQPEPHDSPTMPAEENGFAPLNGDLPEKDDAQTAQIHADPVAHETEPAEVIPTTGSAPDEGGSKTKPTVEGVENKPTGSVEEARYPAQIEEAHPVGFPSD